MSNNKQKLELTWIGKNNPEYDIANIEPRILEERTDLSYGDKDTENMIIHGDNLLALKALLPEYEGKVKCIYIDPPFNTGAAFEHYDDSVEHSTWLTLMRTRLEFLRLLLSVLICSYCVLPSIRLAVSRRRFSGSNVVAAPLPAASESEIFKLSLNPSNSFCLALICSSC